MHVQMIFLFLFLFFIFISPCYVALSSVFFSQQRNKKGEWGHVGSGLFDIMKN